MTLFCDSCRKHRVYLTHKRFSCLPSRVIAGTAEIGMRLFGLDRSLLGLQPVHPGHQDVAHPAVGDEIESQSPLAGRFEPLVAATSSQAHQSERCPIHLFGIRTAGHDPADHLRRKRPRALGPPDEPLRVPLEVRPMRLRSVLGQSRIVVGRVVTDMGGDPLAFVINLYRPLRGPDLDLLVKIPIRDAVVVFGEGDAVVDVHPGPRLLGHLERLGRQRLGQASLRCPSQILPHRLLADETHPGDRPIAQPGNL